MAATEERWQELDRRYGRALSYGLGADLLDPGAVHERVPLIDSDRILGGLFVPTDGDRQGRPRCGGARRPRFRGRRRGPSVAAA